jgi:hypothetical protein
LISANFGIKPNQLQISEWAALKAQAIWLEKFRLTNMAKMLAQLFGGDASKED